jgi:Spy/CpxP family protein refolding chaperone
MKLKVFHLGLAVLTVLATAAAFAVTRHLEQRRLAAYGGAGAWLSLSGAQCRQVQREDPGFREQAGALASRLRNEQQALMGQLQDEDIPDEAIRRQSRRVVDTHHDLMRRVVQHLLVVRRHADTRQCLRLRGLCAGTLACDEERQSAMPQGRGGGTRGQGRGLGMGLGMGRGRGGGHRCSRLAPALALDAAQQEAVLRLDPEFEAEVTVMAASVRQSHAAFTRHLTDVEVSDQAIRASLEELVAARLVLEQRTTEHVLRIRSLLSPEQQQRLIGLSQQGCRWRGGRGNVTEMQN